MRPATERGLRHGLWIVGLFTLALALAHVARGEIGFDAHAYWAAAHHHHFYRASPESVDAYLYSPAFAEGIWPIAAGPWAFFCAVWLLLVAAIYLWLLAPLPLRWRIPALLACTLDIVSGNVWSLFGLVLVAGFRFPGAWAFPALTKVTPVLGPVWFAARREWRNVLISIDAVVAFAAVSMIAAPHFWVSWLHLLEHAKPNGSMAAAFNPPTAALLAVELPIAIAVTVWAARTNRRWLLPVAMLFANPVLTSNALVILAAIPRIRAMDSPD